MCIRDRRNPEQQVNIRPPHPAPIAQSNGSNKSWTGIFKSGRPRSEGSQKSSSSGREVDAHLLNEEERKLEVAKLEKELEKLNECFKLIVKDMDQVNESMSRSLAHLSAYLKATWCMMLKDFTRVMLVWLKDCLKAWENARSTIENING